MKTNRFDDIIKNKVDNIHYSASDAEVDAIFKNIASQSKLTFARKIYAYKFAIIATFLAASIFTNIWMWQNLNTNRRQNAASFTTQPSANPLIAISSKNILSNNASLIIDTTIALNIDQFKVSSAYNNTAIGDVKAVGQSEKKNTTTSLITTKSQPTKLAISENKNTHNRNENHQTINNYDELNSSTTTDLTNHANELLTTMPLHFVFKQLLSDNQLSPKMNIVFSAKDIVPIRPQTLTLPKWELGLNHEINTRNLNFGLIARYNVTKNISIVGSANRYRSLERQFINKSDYENQENENLAEKYKHDFSTYNAVENLNEQVHGYAFTFGTNYKSNLFHNYNIIGGLSSTFNLTSTSNLTFDYLSPPVMNYNRIRLNAYDHDFKFSHFTTSLGLGKRFGGFDFNLLFNANFTKTNKHRHYKNLDFSPGITSRILYAF